MLLKECPENLWKRKRKNWKKKRDWNNNNEVDTIMVMANSKEDLLMVILIIHAIECRTIVEEVEVDMVDHHEEEEMIVGEMNPDDNIVTMTTTVEEVVEVATMIIITMVHPGTTIILTIDEEVQVQVHQVEIIMIIIHVIILGR